MLTQLRRTTPRLLIVACALSLAAAYFAVRFLGVPGASAGSYLSTFLIALPSTIALFRYLGAPTAVLSLLALSAFAYTIEAVGITTGLPYGPFHYGDALGYKIAGLVPVLLPVSYAPLVVGAVASSRGSRRHSFHILSSALLLVWVDAVLDPSATALGLWVWPEGGVYYGVPLSNYAGWLLSGAVASALLLRVGHWSETPPPGLLDSAIIALPFWSGVSVLSGVATPALLGTTLFVFLLARRSQLRAAK